MLAVTMLLSTFTVVFADGVIYIDSKEALMGIVAAESEGKTYVLTTDIDLEGVAWTTIGDATAPFAGIFDGDGHVIKNYNIVADGTNNIAYGLFGVVSGEIKNVGVENIDISTSYADISYSEAYVGGLVGKPIDNAVINSCYAKNVTIDTKTPAQNWAGFTGEQPKFAGGLVGGTAGAGVEILNCYALDFTEIDDSASAEGYLTGGMDRGTFAKVENCYANGTLTTCYSDDVSKFVNCYTTVTDGWSAYGTKPGTLVTVAELKNKHTDLGSAYKAGTTYNNGFPVLIWQADSLPMAGTGTEDDPYIIESKSNLIEASTIADTEGKYFQVEADIDMEGMVWNDCVIGSVAAPFKGIFDGKGHVIKNYKLEVPTGNWRADVDGELGLALFGAIGGYAQIKNLGVEDVKIAAVSGADGWNAYGSALVAYATDDASINGCYAKNVVIDTKTGATVEMGVFGPVAGKLNGAGVTVENCLSLNYNNIGNSASTQDGLVGHAVDFASISNCYTDSTIACVSSGNEEKVTNTYALNKLGWAPDGNVRVGEVVTQSELVDLADTLGVAYKKGGVETNSYPALAWMNITEIEIKAGVGTYNDPYIIADAADLMAMAALTNTDGVYFKMSADIDLEGNEWTTYIGSADVPFKGNFDGNGHIIKNYQILAPAAVTRGIFGVVAGNAYIHDVGVEVVDVILPDQFGWDATVGGLIGAMYDNTIVAGCYVNDIEFKANYVRAETWHGELKWGGGLIGYGNGAGLEVRDCYSKGFKETTESGYDIVNNEGGLFGMLDNFLAIEDCYSDSTMGRYVEKGVLTKNSYHSVFPDEWPEGYTWGYESFVKDVTTLGYDWNNDFVPVDGSSPALKWQGNDGYLNLIPSGEMTGADANALFGVEGGEVVASVDASRMSAVLAMPVTSTFTYNVSLTPGEYYRVSFRGRTQSGEDCGFSFVLGGIDLTENIVDKTLGEVWETKVAYIKADSESAELTISGLNDLLIDDVEIIKVDADLEMTAIESSFIIEKTYADVTKEFYIASPILDGLEIQIDSDYDCVNADGSLNDNVPVGFGTADVTLTLSVNVADKTATKEHAITIDKKQPYDVKTLGLVNADGEKVYGVSAAEKIGTVLVDANTEDEGTIVAALYKDGKLIGMKYAAVADGEAVFDLAIGDADKVKVFAYVADTLMPLSVPEVTYDKIEKGANVVVHTVGDSLCDDYDVNATDLRGWGQIIHEGYFDPEYVTTNNILAESGMTANKFFGEGGAMGGINELIAGYKPGDYFIVQLGTNDSNNFLVNNKGFTRESFRFYMDQFVCSARENGVIPIFVTAPERLSVASDEQNEAGLYPFESGLAGYPDVMREYGEKHNVPVIDLAEYSTELLERYGYTGTKNLGLFVADELHYTEAGATWIADFVASELVRLGLPIGDCLLSK